MRRFLAALFLCAFIAAPAVARDRGENCPYQTVQTNAGPICINAEVARAMAGFVDDVVARGFKGRVHCYSLSHSHVRHSLHFTARACDFAQRGWGKTVAPMYHVADLAARHGLRDGCTFGDCGHIDNGPAVSAGRRHNRHHHRPRHRGNPRKH